MKTKNHNQFVRCVENIQDLSTQGMYEYAILLMGGGMFTRKIIKYNPKTGKYVYSESGFGNGTKHAYTLEQLKKETNVIKAMKNRALIAIID